MATLTLELDDSTWVEIPRTFDGTGYATVEEWATHVGTQMAQYQVDHHTNLPALLALVHDATADYDSDVVLACIPNGEFMVEAVRIDLLASDPDHELFVQQLAVDDSHAFTAPAESDPAVSETLGDGDRVIRTYRNDEDEGAVFLSVRFVFSRPEARVVIGFDTYDLECGALLVPLVEQLAGGISIQTDVVASA